MAKEVVGVKCRCAGGSSASNMSGARIGWAVTGRIRSREERAGEGSAQAGEYVGKEAKTVLFEGVPVTRCG